MLATVTYLMTFPKKWGVSPHVPRTHFLDLASPRSKNLVEHCLKLIVLLYHRKSYLKLMKKQSTICLLNIKTKRDFVHKCISKMLLHVGM
jgi:hypothetical protein